MKRARQSFAWRVTADLIDRRTWIEEGRIAILKAVVGIADVAADFELDVCIDRPDVGILKGIRRFRTSHVLSRPDLDELDSIDLCSAPSARAGPLARRHQH